MPVNITITVTRILEHNMYYKIECFGMQPRADNIELLCYTYNIQIVDCLERSVLFEYVKSPLPKQTLTKAEFLRRFRSFSTFVTVFGVFPPRSHPPAHVSFDRKQNKRRRSNILPNFQNFPDSLPVKRDRVRGRSRFYVFQSLKASVSISLESHASLVFLVIGVRSSKLIPSNV